MKRKFQLAGKSFARLFVIGERGTGPHGRTLWLCRCDCGKRVVVTTGELNGSKVKSCGCLRHEQPNNSKRTHGLSKTRAYLIWRKMVDRCTNPQNKAWAYYGGRGIGVCQRWRVFENFLSDMGNPPVGKMLDRTDNNKGYKQSNCRWVTRKEQMRNKRNNKFLTLNGQTMCFAAWAEKLKVSPYVIARMARNQQIARGER